MEVDPQSAAKRAGHQHDEAPLPKAQTLPHEMSEDQFRAMLAAAASQQFFSCEGHATPLLAHLPHQAAQQPTQAPPLTPTEVVATQEYLKYQAAVAGVAAAATANAAAASAAAHPEALWKQYLFTLGVSVEQMEKGPAMAIPPRTDQDRQYLKDWLVPLGKWPAEAPPPTLQQAMEAVPVAPSTSPAAASATLPMVDPAHLAPTAPMQASQVEQIPGPQSVVA